MRLRRLEPAHTAEDVTTARPLSKALTKKMPMKMKNGRVCEKKEVTFALFFYVGNMCPLGIPDMAEIKFWSNKDRK